MALLRRDHQVAVWFLQNFVCMIQNKIRSAKIKRIFFIDIFIIFCKRISENFGREMMRPLVQNGN